MMLLFAAGATRTKQRMTTIAEQKAATNNDVMTMKFATSALHNNKLLSSKPRQTPTTANKPVQHNANLRIKARANAHARAHVHDR